MNKNTPQIYITETDIIQTHSDNIRRHY